MNEETKQEFRNTDHDDILEKKKERKKISNHATVLLLLTLN